MKLFQRSMQMHTHTHSGQNKLKVQSFEINKLEHWSKEMIRTFEEFERQFYANDLFAFDFRRRIWSLDVEDKFSTQKIGTMRKFWVFLLFHVILNEQKFNVKLNERGLRIPWTISNFKEQKPLSEIKNC